MRSTPSMFQIRAAFTVRLPLPEVLRLEPDDLIQERPGRVDVTVLGDDPIRRLGDVAALPLLGWREHRRPRQADGGENIARIAARVTMEHGSTAVTA